MTAWQGAGPKEKLAVANAVILNDTRGDSHFGCFRVMRLIEENLAGRGIRVLARSGVRNDWENDRPFLDAMAKSDLIVINGEGTLHHGAKAGARLLRVVDHPVRGDKPVALIKNPLAGSQNGLDHYELDFGKDPLYFAVSKDLHLSADSK